jgi:4-diphosphocytidyl-2-C-methyl-D-erythritol kinase
MTSPPSARTVIALAHAKVNLLLRILAREASGYHGVETLYQRLALHDVVTVTVDTPTRTLACTGEAMPAGGLGPPESNLAWRAAAAYTAAAGWDTGWHLAIDKRIPVGGGLGGGSADAAAVLQALDRLAPRPLGAARVLELAGKLGADVPFLALGAARAWGWGRGDRLLALPPLPAMGVTLVAFQAGVETAAAYRAVAAARTAHPQPVPAMAYPAEALGTWDTVCALGANDFEAVVPSLHGGVAAVLPLLQAAEARLRAEGYPALALLSGSGATCFLLHPPGAPTGVPLEALPAGARLVATQTA